MKAGLAEDQGTLYYECLSADPHESVNRVERSCGDTPRGKLGKAIQKYCVDLGVSGSVGAPGSCPTLDPSCIHEEIRLELRQLLREVDDL